MTKEILKAHKAPVTSPKFVEFWSIDKWGADVTYCRALRKDGTYDYVMYVDTASGRIERSSINGPRFSKLRGRINAAIIAAI